MNSYLKSLARILGRTMLLIKATTYRSEPYKWASGMLMHIYNDNRMMLGVYSHRWRIAAGFAELIKGHKVSPTYILGTSTAGIAPATSVAQYMKKKMLINEGGKFYLYEEGLLKSETFKYQWFKEFSTIKPGDRSRYAIVTTSPLAIPYGVQYANEFKVGFAYVRKNAKDHGKELQVEGNLKRGTKVVLMFTGTSEDDVTTAHNTTVKTLEDMGCIVLSVYGIDLLNGSRHKEATLEDLRNKKTAVIEDLFSTGGSAAYEVFQLRQAGAICNYCFSIFSYDFDVLKKQFSGESEIGTKRVWLSMSCITDTLLPFSILCEEMEKLGFFSEEIRISMKEEIENFDLNYQKFLQTNGAS